jgi:isopenicillin N synthase-like dioxygenase
VLINIDDMSETWTNGHFVATSDRVREVAEERYSFPLFRKVDYGPVAEPLFVQTATSFQYLRTKLDDGTLALPVGSVSPNQKEFGQEARHGEAVRSSR